MQRGGRVLKIARGERVDTPGGVRVWDGNKIAPPGEGGGGAGRGARTPGEIRRNPQDGDELPLKDGGRARYNGNTKKWEKAQ